LDAEGVVMLVFCGLCRIYFDKYKGCSCPNSRVEPGRKFDGEKPRLNLLMQEVPYGLEQLALTLQLGEDKYGRGNWREVENKEDRYLAALLRHLVAYNKGEKLDPESGLSHLAHVASNAMFLLDNEASKQ
jgi:hypothetical protein